MGSPAQYSLGGMDVEVVLRIGVTTCFAWP